MIDVAVRAARTVLSVADSPAEAREFLEMLGLLENGRVVVPTTYSDLNTLPPKGN